MNALVEIGLSNAVVATALAPFVAALTIRRSRPALVHALWLVVLLKLVTPPIVSVGVPGWSGRTEQTNGDTGLVAVAAAPPGAVTASRDAAWTSERVLHPFAPEIAPRDEHAPTNGAVRLAPQERREIDAVALRRPPSTAPHVEEVSLDTGLTTPVAATESLGGQPAAWPSWPVAIGTVWLAGSFVCFVVAALRIARFQRLLRLAGRAPAELQAEVARLARHLGLARVPRVEMVDGHVSPLVWPLARNVWLVLPSGLLARLSAEERTTLLAHELVHIRRRDHWVRLVELTAAGLYWWHPVAWWARRRLRAAEEECCDAWVVESLPEMCTSYARALVAVVGFLQDTADGRRCLPSPASGLGEFGALRQRLTNIFEGNQPARLTRRVRWAVAALALVLLPLALGRTAPPVVEGREGRGAAEAPLAVAAVDDDRQPNQPADPDDRPLAGTVLDSQGQPVARCDVWLMTSTFNTTAGILGYAPTDAAGRFRFVVPGRWFRTNVTFRQEIGLLAHVPGSRPAALGFDRHSIPPAEGVELVLRPQSVTSFQVLGPDGQPVAGADVALTALAAESLWADLSDEEARSFAEGGHLPFRATPLGPIVGKVSVPLPDGFSRLFVSRTDAQGNVELVGLAIEDVAAVTIKSPVYGEQRRALNFIESGNDARPWPGTITLAAVGSLSGRLVSDDSAAVRRVTFTVTSIPPYDPETYVPGNMHTSGIAQVTTDDDGRFDVPRLAQGGLVFSFPTTHADRSRARVPPNRSLRIAGGEQTQVEIPFVRAVRAGGVVRERGTKKPIAGAVVMVLGEDATDEVVTDDQGRYECYIAPGEVMPDPIATSRFVPIDREEYTRLLSKIPADAAEFEFPPIELTPAPTIQGRVIDGDERPAPGAVVRARWLAQDRRHGVDTLHDRELVADERGEFELLGVDPNKELHVEVWSMAGWGAVTARLGTDADKPLTIPLVADDLVSLSGRVVDASEAPVADATVTIVERSWMPEGHVGAQRQVNFGADVQLRTNAEGRFETPRELSRQTEYHALVHGVHEAVDRTPWLKAADAGAASFDDLRVRRLRTITGQVADRQGRPVVGARVYQCGDTPRRQETATGAQGRFRLPAAIAPGFLFVSDPGFRFHGQLVEPADGEIDLTLVRADETPANSMATLPPALAQTDRLALARQLLDPVLKETLDKGTDSEKLRTLEALAGIDPGEVMERLEKRPFANTWNDDYLRRAAARRLAVDGADDALAVIETMQDAGFRSMGYLDVYDALPQAQRQQ